MEKGYDNLNKSNELDAQAQVIVLLGQSNAEGNSHSKYLVDKVGHEKAQEYINGYEGVKISYANSEFLNTSEYKFVPVCAAQGYTLERFGPELGMAEKIVNTDLDNEVFIIKYTYGGTAIKDEWRPPSCGGSVGHLYTETVEYVNTQCELLRSMGYEPVIKAICWMQGESDAERENFEDYTFLEGNLKQDLRDAFLKYKPQGEEIAFVDAGISDCPAWIEYIKVNASKNELALADEYHDYIDTIKESLPYGEEPYEEPDIYHYDCLGSIKLGHLFAEVLLNKYLK
jgi:hypothetical protein